MGGGRLREVVAHGGSTVLIIGPTFLLIAVQVIGIMLRFLYLRTYSAPNPKIQDLFCQTYKNVLVSYMRVFT